MDDEAVPGLEAGGGAVTGTSPMSRMSALTTFSETTTGLDESPGARSLALTAGRLPLGLLSSAQTRSEP